jgi:1-acyl-sn-glycerol-3-phosphate acyltransferase
MTKNSHAARMFFREQSGAQWTMALEPDIPPVSALTYRLFARTVRRQFRRHFSTVLAQRTEVLERASGPLIIYANHASWWDPFLTVLLGRMLMPGRRAYAPIDAELLARSPVLGKVGFFPVDRTSPQSRAQLLHASEAALRENAVLWLTPQVRHTDVREYPLAFRPGMAELVERMPQVTVVPLAVEYTFWDQPLPEVLVRCGPAQPAASFVSGESTTRQLEAALATTMLELQQASCSRDQASFRVLLQGKRSLRGALPFARRFGHAVELARTGMKQTPRL